MYHYLITILYHVWIWKAMACSELEKSLQLGRKKSATITKRDTYIADLWRESFAFLFAIFSVIFLYSFSEIVPSSKRYLNNQPVLRHGLFYMLNYMRVIIFCALLLLNIIYRKWILDMENKETVINESNKVTETLTKELESLVFSKSDLYFQLNHS